MARLSRAEIIAAQDPPGEIVAVPEWGGDVFVRALTSADVLDMAKRYGTSHGDVPLLVYAVVDEQTSERLFTPEDIAALQKKALGPVMRVLAAVKRLSGLGDDAPKAVAGSS
jgi:hypothetical protein